MRISEKITSVEIFNYVRKLELENAALKTALAEYEAENKKQEVKSNGVVICY